MSFFQQYFLAKGGVLDFDFPFFIYTFGPGLLPSIRFGCNTTFILSQFLDHNETITFFQIAEVRTSGDKSKFVDERIERGRFLFYWFTSTIIATSTSTSGTITFTVGACTPSGFAFSTCTG